MKEMRITFNVERMMKLSAMKTHRFQRNKHSKKQIERLSLLMREHGVRQPIHVNPATEEICFGHGRKEAALLNGWEEYPVVYQKFKSEEEEYAVVQADNAAALWSELDFASIQEDIKKFKDFNPDLLGIKNFKVPYIIKSGNTDADEVPTETKTDVQLGDVFVLGNHRLVCGSSTSTGDFDKLMNGEVADICFTSPPYNLGSNAKLRGKNASGNDAVYRDDNDSKSNGKFYEFMMDWSAPALVHSKYLFCNIQMLAGNKLDLITYIDTLKHNLVDIMIWDKEHGAPAMAPNVLNSAWEFVFILKNEQMPKRSIKSGNEFRGTLPNIFRLNPNGKKDPLAKDHGAVFPVAFAEHFISNFTKSSVLDCFGGSGTTMIAAEKLNRKCFMMELDPHYCSVIIERWERFTGAKANKI